MLEMGIIIAIGLIATLAKLSWRLKMWVLSHPVFMDILVFIFLVSIHWGSFSGVMIASIGALFCSVTLSAGRWAVGHMEHGKYVPGKFDMSHKLKD